MSVTITSDVPNTVLAAYAKSFNDTFWPKLCYFNFVNWEPLKQGTGSSYTKWFSNPLDRDAQTRTEGQDITPITAKDMSALQITWVDIANGVQMDRMIKYQSQVDMFSAAGKQVGKQQADYLDYWVREKMLQGTLVKRMNNRATRAAVVVGDTPTYSFITECEATLDANGVEPYADDTYVAVIHPLAAHSIVNSSQFTNVVQYSDPKMFYEGKPMAGAPRFKNERFRVSRTRFVVDPLGKMFWGAGTPAQTATTLGDDVAAGATSITVADATGLAAGNYITIGTIESSTTSRPTTEQVEITAVDGTTLTIRGQGNAFDNHGVKFAHASGAAVTEAPNVCGCLFFGANTMYGMYEDGLGKEGQQFAKKDVSTFLPDIIWDFGWHWVGGASLVNKHCLRAEFATAVYMAGSN